MIYTFLTFSYVSYIQGAYIRKDIWARIQGDLYLRPYIQGAYIQGVYIQGAYIQKDIWASIQGDLYLGACN